MRNFSAKLQKLLSEPSFFVILNLFQHLKKDEDMSFSIVKVRAKKAVFLT